LPHPALTAATARPPLPVPRPLSRRSYVERFKAPVHCQLVSRTCLGNVVVDRETLTGLPSPDGAPGHAGKAECLAVYHVDIDAGKIVKMQLHWQAA
jgi:hypothetical protein